jgi:hypothetical protein
MNIKLFMTVVAASAIGVGTFGIGWPASLLQSKGADLAPATLVWVREVGILILAQGATTFLMRHQPPSKALRAFLIGGALTQVGLFPIEIVAYAQGAVTRLSGIVPNSLLHLVFAWGFAACALRVSRTDAEEARKS